MRVQYLSPVLIGREAESDALRRAFDATAGGEPRAVLVAGESGVGKSRVVAEFLDDVGDAARVLLGGCIDLQAGELPYAPFIAALRDLVADPGPERLRELVPHGAAEYLSGVLPGINGDGPADGDDTRARMFEYLLALLAGLTERERRPVVLVVEDAHWADRSSLDLLDFLLRSLQAASGLMVVVTLRSAELHRTHPLRNQLAELARLPWVQRLELARLDRRGLTELIRQVLDGEPDPDLVDVIHRRSEGNPLFAEELLRCELAAEDCRVPPSLEDLLLDRIRRLPEPAAHVVKAASVAGKRIAHPLLAAVVRRVAVNDAFTASGAVKASFTAPTPGALDGALRAAVDGGALVVDGDGYAFRHALIREAVYNDLLPGERTALHARYAEVLHDEGAPAGEVAHHLFSSGDMQRGIPAAWQASRDAHRALAYAEELVLLDCILKQWDDLPDTAALLGVTRTSALERATEAAARAGAHQRGVELATAALAALDPKSDRVRTALMLERRGTMLTSLGEPAALDDHRAAVDIIPADHPARAYLLNSLAARLMQVPAAEDAQHAATEALRIAREAVDPPAEAAALITLAVVQARASELDPQLPQLARARAIADAVGATQVTLRAWHSESHLLQAFGRLEEAVAAARAGLAAAIDAGLARASGPAHVVDLAGALTGVGQWDEALDAIDYGIGLAPPAGYHAQLLYLRAFVDLHRGDLEAAARAAGAGCERMAAEQAFPQDPLLAERVDAELRLAEGKVADALQVVADAVAHDHLLPASRFLWPLLVIGAQAIRRADANGAADAVGLLDTLRRRASQLRVNGPVQAAWALTFAAEAGSASGAPDAAAWAEAVAAWERLVQPLRLAQALTGAAETALADGDREAGAAALRRAAGIAERLAARRLAADVDSLARRARIPVNGAATPRAGGAYGLTPRELEILRLVADGRSNGQIAGELFIAQKTASVHVSHILAKLGVTNRVEAAAAAHRLGLVGAHS